MTATVSPTPCLATRVTQPESSPQANAPAGMAAKSRPSAAPPPGGSPKVRSAISGKSALGIPATIAMTSTSSPASRTRCPER